MKSLLKIFVVFALLLGCAVMPSYAWVTKQPRYDQQEDPHGRSENDLFYDGFDSEEPGASPAGYTVGSSRNNGGSVQIVDISDDIYPENGALCIEDTDPDGYYGMTAYKNFSEQSEIFALEFKFMIAEASGNYLSFVRLAKDSNICLSFYSNSGTLYLSSDSGTVTAGMTATKGIWYKVRIIVRPQEGTADLTIISPDKEWKYKDFSFPVNENPFNRLYLVTQVGTPTVYYDYLKIEKNPAQEEEGEREVIEAPRVPDPVPHAVEGKINILYNGVYQYFVNQPIMVEDRVLLPFRSLFEMLSMEVTWDGAANTATASSEGCRMEITVDSETALVNGMEKRLDVPATLMKDRVYIPLRFAAENTGAEVSWEEDTQTVVIQAREEQ